MRKIVRTSSVIRLETVLDRQTKIPLYQRFYDWDRPLIEQMLADIIQSQKIHKNLYLGAIIDKWHGKQIELIDGQQRLLTLLILLRVVCDVLQEKRTAARKRLYDKIDRKLRAIKLNFAKGVLVELNEQQQGGYFTQVILHGGKWAGEKRSGRVFEEARKVIKDALCEERIVDTAQLGDLYQFLLKRIEIIDIELSSGASETEIFEAINAKRKELATVDNIKNLLFRSDKKHWNTVADRWEKLCSKFSSVRSLEAFIAYYATATSKKDSEISTRNSRKLLSVFRSKLGNPKIGSLVPWSTIENLFSELDSYSDAFFQLTDPSHRSFGQQSAATTSLRTSVKFSIRNNFVSHLPLLMRISVDFRDRSTTVSRLMAAVELKHFSDRLNKKYPQKTKKYFLDLLLDYKLGKLTKLTLLRKIRREVETTELHHSISKISKANGNNDQQIIYVLHRILCHRKPELVDKTYKELEHIFPKGNLKPEWKKVLERDLARVKWTEYLPSTPRTKRKLVKEYQLRFIHSLGNCALLRVENNRSIQDKPFRIKLDAYRREIDSDANATLQWVVSRSGSSWDHKQMMGNAKWLAKEFTKSFG